MARDWRIDGSHAEYWRSDNPLLAAWYRFGNAPPKNNFATPDEQSATNYLSGLMVDSSQQKHHLLSYPRATDDATLWSAVPSIAPWDPDGSGCQVNCVTHLSQVWNAYADPGFVIQNSASTIDHGTLGNGVVLYSGITVIGWAKIPQIPVQNNTGAQRLLVGRADQDTSLSTNTLWRITWNQPNNTTDYFLQSTFLSQANFTVPAGTRVLQNLNLLSTDEPNFPRDRTQPFWFALQIMREAVEGNRSFTGNGSGLARLMIGTAESGVCATVDDHFRGTDVDLTFITPDFAGVPLSVFNETRGFRSATQTTNRHLPSGSILDELVIVNDGMMSVERILHYALSGMTHVTTSDPEHPDFEPAYPGSSGLVAYWSFDDDTGTNSAPSTEGDPRLELSLSGLGSTMSFVDGVNDGRALRMTPATSITSLSEGATLLNSNSYALIPAESGLSLLFPSGHVVDEGMTIIGWSRAVPTGNNLLGGAFGWFGAGGRQNAFWTETAVDASPAPNTNVISVTANISGAPTLVTNGHIRVYSFQNTTTATNRPGKGIGLSNSATVSDPEYDTSDDGWHLWAGIYDIKHGTMFMVKDAKFLIPMTQQFSSASGLSSDGLGPNEGFFGFCPRSTRSWEIDNFAVYNRILTIPEMSGFALLGIGQPAPDPVLSTPMKSLVGYWRGNNFTNYDPAGVSGYRVDDRSWYFHHLTNVSGSFTIGTRLNPEITSITGSLRSALSGSMISLERTFHGSNLDLSSTNSFANSGMSAGAWVFLPSGDLSSQGHGSSGLDGDHMLMGSWSQSANERSWFLGIRGNKPHFKFVDSASTLYEYTSTATVPFNVPFFIGLNIFPSGAVLRGQMVQAGSEDTSIYYTIDQTFGLADDVAQASSASGFSLFNAPGLDYGFPQTTKMGLIFMNMGYLSEDQWIATKRSAVDNIVISSGSVSVSDPANISHWRFDRAGELALDYGREQNHLYPINTDSHKLGVERAIHSSGAVVRQPEYLDTIPSNPGSRRLDLGSGTQSWTALGWVKPPEVSNLDQHVILNKGSGPASSPTGIQIYTPADSLQATAIAATLSAAAQNGDLAPGEWNHLAVTYDRDNDQFGVIVNARYAGTSFVALQEIAVNNSGMVLGGRGDQVGNALNGGSAFSGILDDFMLFGRALTLPEISGLAANSYNFNEGAQSITASMGGFVSGIAQSTVSGLIGAWLHGMAQEVELVAGYVSGVSGVVSEWGGFIHGRAFVSGLTGAFTHGLASQSGTFGHFIHGLDIASGLLGSYMFGASQAQDEFDVTLTFSIVTSKDFDARLGVEKTEIYDFDSRLGVIRITQPPECSIELPEVGLIASGTPYTLTVQGSGIAFENKKVSLVRFTFADFKGAELGTLVDGVPFSGLYQASRTFDTPGWYTVKIEVLDSYGYRGCCARPFLLVPSGSTSGAYLASLPGISISGTPVEGSTVHRAYLTHSLSGLDNTSGVLEYTDFSDQQESLVNSLEMPSGTQFTDFVRTHDYTMPGHYVPVWAVSGSWGIVSDSLEDGIDYLG